MSEIDFDAIKLKLASPEKILEWSCGEVKKPETIDYRTQRPKKDGLFCEKIFGPTKDWECYCGKYKRIRYKGVVCDKCGVEVTRSIVRRERMGHIKLYSPVSHIWFLRGVPSKVGLILDLSVQNLEKVIYFANYIITSVDKEAKQRSLEQINNEYKSKRKSIKGKYERLANELKQKSGSKKIASQKKEEKLSSLYQEREKEFQSLKNAFESAKKELSNIKKLRIISEVEYGDLSLKYGQVFQAGIGAEAVRKILQEIDLEKLAQKLEAEVGKASPLQNRKIKQRLKLIRGMIKAEIRPEWMILTILPVIPPDLRPMVQLDGGRFATSDLNDLYRRVINRNNRLKRLIELNAPEVICRNEKRMLQEAVDALIDNTARRGKAVAASTGQKRLLKSLADMLKGKQGRFRQNLLGKRVDYSGRSVIVIGPHLKLYQCGLPKTMALELFKPFVIYKLIKRELAHNVRSASKLVEEQGPEVWDALEEVIQNHLVLLNRAPTLHRLGIQAFQPVLIEGKAIQIHPMVCAAFNADFDGDQMAVHVPLTDQAQKEAANIMASEKNLLKPATGQPITTASQDIVLGIHYMSQIKKGAQGEGKFFSSPQEVLLALDLGDIDLRASIKIRIKEEIIETCAGRIIFNGILPKEMRFLNQVLNKKDLIKIISECLDKYGSKRTVRLVDDIKKLGFKFLTKSGLSWGMDDMRVPEKKTEILKKAMEGVEEIRQQYRAGLLTDNERYIKTIEVWAKSKDEISDACMKALDLYGSARLMIESGARGSWSQIIQMMGMRGLMTNPTGKTIELPVKSSFKEGLDVLEYFISTHGARKGLTDTALRTANAGYLTRRLIDVSQDVMVKEEDCGDTEGFVLTAEDSKNINMTLLERCLGRVVAEDVKDEKTGQILISKDQLVTREIISKLANKDISRIRIRSILSCKTREGICQKCYGWDLGNKLLVKKGQAVGIVAAQSIGEPGTQLTMRTFHTGGVAGEGDITQGLPRVEELFEARAIKEGALIAEINGFVHIEENKNEKIIRIISQNKIRDSYGKVKTDKIKLKVKKGYKIEKGEVMAQDAKGKDIKAKNPGIVDVENDELIIIREAEEKEYKVLSNAALWVKQGDLVVKGQQLTEGRVDLRYLFKVAGREAVQRYILKEVQYIYSSQGQDVNDKHVEIIVRQMLSYTQVKDSGESDLLVGQIINRLKFDDINRKLKKEGKKLAEATDLLLGVSKAALATESFLSAASFQETARVLINAAIAGKVDYLKGLKENVIIGRLIPAGTGYRL